MPEFSAPMPPRTLLGTAALFLSLAAGCSYSHGEEPTPCNDSIPSTYAAVVSPIFDASCRSCHGSGVYQTLGGGNNYGTYEGIKNQSGSLLLGSIEHLPGYDAMPKGAPKLSDCDIARIKAWIDAGEPNN